MRFTPRTWSLLSVLLFIAAAFFWMKGNDLEERQRQAIPAASSAQTNAAVLDLMSTSTAGGTLARLQAPAAAEAPVDPNFPLRLRNTSRTLDDLGREEKAILLANALLDTASGQPLEIPAHLKSAGDPGSYVVQSDGPATAGFRALLREAGAEVISYVPNNAYFVKLNEEGAARLEGEPSVQAVLPFEPYFKLERGLLQAAVDQTPLNPAARLRLTLIPGMQEQGAQEIATIGGEILAEEPSAFGPQLLVRILPNSLASLARITSVQAIEMEGARLPASDLTRVSLGIATNGSASNYLNLTGSNIWVNFNDGFVDINHPALQGRVVVGHPGMATTDRPGHGTFVAGLIAGNGANSPAGTNVFASETNASFRGMAPLSKLFGLPLDIGEDVTASVSDTYLIETAARTNYLALDRDNALISNNSWVYSLTDEVTQEPVGAISEYNSASARYDAAVRDSLPGASGSQPILFVFAAGNEGFGNEDGRGGQLGRISSPGTAKNVITVGAVETFREIDVSYFETNVFTDPFSGEQITNVVEHFPFFALTDSTNQVASFSSRGNVGIGIEGDFGRFKPDVVAPGAMLVSARSSGWRVSDEVDTNSNYGEMFSLLHTNLTEYRYDSGTTYSAATVSGMLALIQEYFEAHAPADLRGPLSPALLKGLLINSSRSLTEFYDLAVRSSGNFQGWGLPNLPNALASYHMTNAHSSLDIQTARLRFVDQEPENALATGQSRTWNVTLSTNASAYPLRISLVWTDPPGNPLVGIKLVNDLDLIVTNKETGVIFYGNNIGIGTDFTQPSTTNDAPVFDFVNNVENVLVRNPSELGREFSITIRARRVNVDAVNEFHANADPRTSNDVVQDFALVVSSDMGADPRLNSEIYFPDENVFESFVRENNFVWQDRPVIQTITNGFPLLEERLGANPALATSRGMTNQWNFYVFENVHRTNDYLNITNGPNVAFITFTPPNLGSVPRNIDADIDLYVSRDPGLLDLEPAAIAGAWKSTERGGEESVIFTNAPVGPGVFFYVGVKSEDQKAAEYSFIGISTLSEFDKEENGQRVLQGVPFSNFLPDGAANRPSAIPIFAIGLSDKRVQRVVVETQLSHENTGDLVGVLRHKGLESVLNNHTLNNGTNSGTNIFLRYDDTPLDASYPPAPGSIPTDGPGTLNNFVGAKITGPWELMMIDNAPSHTGRVELVTLYIDPLQDPLLSGEAITRTFDTETLCFPIDVLPGVTNMVFRFFDMSPNPGAQIRAMIRRDQLPTMSLFEMSTDVSAPGGTFSFPPTNGVPLTPGTYFLCLDNLNPGTPVTFSLLMLFEFGNDPANREELVLDGPRLLDNASTNQIVDILADKVVTSAKVSVRMEHPRVADTVLALHSPQGTRILLMENRGFSTSSDLGFTYVTTNSAGDLFTNYTYTVFTDDTNFARIPVKFAPVPLSPTVFTGPIFTNGFETASGGVYTAPTTFDGWTVLSNSVEVIVDPALADTGANFLILTDGFAATNLPGAVSYVFPTTAGVEYELEFATRSINTFDTGTVESEGVKQTFIVAGTNWVLNTFRFVPSTNGAPVVLYGGPGIWLDSFVLRETGNNYYLPEEALVLLNGERAMGAWRLEVIDSRTGAALPDAEILEWKLDLTYADPIVRVEPLRAGVTYPRSVFINQTNRITPGVIMSNQVHYFRVDTCPDTTRATITVMGFTNRGELQLLVDRDGVPTGFGSDDYIPLRNFEGPVTSQFPYIEFEITTNSPAAAPLIPGRPLFLAVRGYYIHDQTISNRFTIRADLDRSGCVVPFPLPLEAGASTESMLSASAVAAGEEQSTEGEIYAIEVPEGEESITFQASASGDIALVAQPGSIPTRASHAYGENSGGGTEALTISAAGGLTPGTWYVRVLNNSLEPVSYSLAGTLGSSAGPALAAENVNGTIVLRWNGVEGQPYAVQSSTDLIDWTTIETVTGQGASTSFTPPSQDDDHRFFRLLQE